MTNMLKIDGCDEALLGTVERVGEPPCLCYDYSQLILAFVEQGMTYEEAVEWIDYNIVGAWMGEGTPYILYRRDLKDLEEEGYFE